MEKKGNLSAASKLYSFLGKLIQNGGYTWCFFISHEKLITSQNLSEVV
jgi:hypothetical protein